VVSREVDVKTVLRSHSQHWGYAAGGVTGNVKDLIFMPIASPAARLAALLTGAVDLVLDPSPQDLARLNTAPGFKLQSSVENRVVFLGFDQQRDSLLHGSLKTANPLKDLRVRQAIAQAINTGELQTVVLRGQSLPTGCMAPAPQACNLAPQLDAQRWPFNLTQARALLAKAGYSQGFEVAMDCPSKYEPTCVAIAGMLARIDIKLRVNSMPLAPFFDKLEKFDTSMYLLAWEGAEADPQPMMDPLMHSWQPSTGRGVDNYGRFADAQLDALITASAKETDPALRAGQVHAALQRHFDNIYHLPLHRPMLTWAMRDTVQPVLAANGHMRGFMVRVGAAPVR
jgi:peptide/nickel transport system substrate-binding protein